MTAGSLSLRELRHRPVDSLVLLAAFLVPIKLAAAYAALVPLICAWLWLERRRIVSCLRSAGPALSAFVLFVLVIALSAPFGINPARTFSHMTSLCFFLFTMFAMRDGATRLGALPVLLALLGGQTLAALYSVIEAAFPEGLPPLFVGKLAESGQLALSVLVALGAFFSLSAAEQPVPENRDVHLRPTDCLWAAANAALLIVVAFARSAGAEAPVFPITAGIAAVVSFALCARLIRLPGGGRRALAVIVLPLLVAALLVNLKRGPWLGVGVGSLVFLLMYARRFVAPLLAIVLLTIALVGPVRERLAASSQHFFIAGGRSVIWSVGQDLALRYPLGIGFSNSPFLQKFDPSIPPELKHFHNNLLNITVEGGWLALAVFVWWLVALLRLAFERRSRAPESVLAVAAGCALLSWQLAGIVEYNFGDSEVLLVAYVVAGALLAIRRPAPEAIR